MSRQVEDKMTEPLARALASSSGSGLAFVTTADTFPVGEGRKRKMTHLNDLKANVTIHPRIEATRNYLDDLEAFKKHISIGTNFHWQRAFWESMCVWLVDLPF